MDENSFSKISKKLPPVKTGLRFGAKLAQTKKVGLFSERRFLIFTKKGPIEITFKPAHYSAAFLMLVVGFTSIVYWSVIGLSSAIDVAQKDIITEASANFVNKESFDKEISLKSDTSLNEDIESSDVNVKSDFESNITIPNHKKPYFKTNPVFKDKNKTLTIEARLDDLVVKKDNQKRNLEKTLPSVKFEVDRSIKEKLASVLKEKNIFDKENKIQPKMEESITYLTPPKLDDRAKNYRFIASLDNELILMEKVFNSLTIKIKDSSIIETSKLIKDSSYLKPDSKEFLFALKQRLELLSIYKEAIQYIPLKPPMEHYYVSSKYGKRKHPVLKKWAFHHGIDLAGTWQESISVSADGIVVFAGYHGSFGKVIRIRHNFGIMTTYGHLAKILVKKGQIVTEGQVIGKMGKTGRVKGAHLHYEISVNGKSKDPAKFFKIGRNLLSRNSIKSFAEFK